MSTGACSGSAMGPGRCRALAPDPVAVSRLDPPRRLHLGGALAPVPSTREEDLVDVDVLVPGTRYRDSSTYRQPGLGTGTRRRTGSRDSSTYRYPILGMYRGPLPGTGGEQVLEALEVPASSGAARLEGLRGNPQVQRGASSASAPPGPIGGSTTAAGTAPVLHGVVGPRPDMAFDEFDVIPGYPPRHSSRTARVDDHPGPSRRPGPR